MFLLVPAHPGFPGQIPQSRKTVVCVCVCVKYGAMKSLTHHQRILSCSLWQSDPVRHNCDSHLHVSDNGQPSNIRNTLKLENRAVPAYDPWILKYTTANITFCYQSQCMPRDCQGLTLMLTAQVIFFLEHTHRYIN